MLSAHDRLIPNSAEIAAEVIDGEAIIINLATGMYFSMDRVGGLVWSLIEERQSLRDIAAALTARFDVNPSQAERDLAGLTADLLHHKLVVVDGNATPTSAPVTTAGDREPYQSPTLTAYRDMSDLLALDPPAPGLTGIPWKPRDGSGE